MAKTKILFGTDFHGSEVCFRKVFNLAERIKADIVILGGDWTGKAFVPIVESASGYRAELLGNELTASTRPELEEMEKQIRFNGFYSFRCDEDEYEAISTSASERDRLFQEVMIKSVERWIDIAEEKLNGSDRICVSLPGNDDVWEIDAALDRSTRVLNSDGRLIDCGDLSIMGFGGSNPTPWDTPRESSEQVIAERLQEIVGDSDGPLLANIHVPPYHSTLDQAPQLNENLEMVKEGGSPVMIPVGSTAVREFIEARQPLVGFHGHVHESKSHNKLGSSLVVNPGSEYSSGVLQAVSVTVDTKKRKVRGHQFISG